MKKIIGIFLFLLPLGLAFQASAGMVPGTISKGSYTDNVFCNSTSPSYSPTDGTYWCSTYNSCAASACWVNKYNSCATAACGSYNNTCATSACGCASYNASGACVAYNSCANAACGTSYNTCEASACWVQSYNVCATSACGCAAYSSSPTGGYNLTDYTNNSKSPTFNSAGVSRKLGIDSGRTCSTFAYKSQNLVEPNWGTWSCPMGNCSPSSHSTRYGGSSAVCGTFSSTDNLISSFDQIGNMTTVTPSDSDNTCTVDGRYASADDSGPSVSVNGVSSVFDSDADNWCAMNKYRNTGTYGTAGNPELTGCTYYRSKNPFISGADPKSTDLLKGLEITVSDPSGISSVQVEIGSCNATYTLSNSLSNILTSPSGGIKSAYTNFTLKYDTSITVDGTTLPSLLSKLGQTRLDGCLLEGKNFIRVTTLDSARSDSDAISFAPNTFVFDYSAQNKFLKVDNTSPKAKLTGDASKFYESNNSPTCYIGGALIDAKWKNYTVTGNFQSGDPFGNNAPDCSAICTVLTGSTLTCAGHANVSGVANLGWSNPQDPVYASPGWINPTTGQFTGYTCDGLGPYPNTNSCDWGCKAGYEKDPVSKTCIPSGGKMFILFDSASPEASGPYAARLTNDTNTSNGLLASESQACSVPANASSSARYKNFQYSAGAQYGPFGFLPGKKWPIVYAGWTTCTPVCWNNYMWTSDTSGGSCYPLTKTAQCALPTNYANTVWNTKGYIPQTWNGTGPTTGSWAPSVPATAYSTTADDLLCNYKCESGYNWSGTACVPASVNGACGTANGTTVSTKPESNLCASGNATAVSGSGPWTWGCTGTNGGTNTAANACSASKTADPFCTAWGPTPCTVGP